MLVHQRVSTDLLLWVLTLFGFGTKRLMRLTESQEQLLQLAEADLHGLWILPYLHNFTYILDHISSILSSSRIQLQEFLAKSFVKGHHDFNRKLVLPRPNDAPPNLLQTHVLEILLKNSTLAHLLSVLQFCNNRHGNTHENTHTHIDIKWHHVMALKMASSLVEKGNWPVSKMWKMTPKDLQTCRLCGLAQ